ncbi:GTPase SAR1 family protein [Oceanisphaera litoralis]|uniref:dynamin family protein n=1 Tax=Oceanisphaera litoralis TaxID=225144 RepID=UPI0019560F6F|nr:dynamin family protein [Oceanisphaera litoralis]MBM7456865.1 GTPase SAR1 family protein [Oceanisphaera litoralis]
MNANNEKIKNAIIKISKVRGILNKLNFDDGSVRDVIEKVDLSFDFIKCFDRKPVIGFFGQFDAGKSTLVNSLTNDGILPTNYQPATCVINILMHEDDRPEHINSKVAIFRQGFKPYMISEKALCKKYLVEDGGESTLKKLGAHSYNESSLSGAHVAVIFSNAEILKSTWLLDTPGTMNEFNSDDGEKALSALALVDGIIFLSRVSGFMSDSEIYYLSELLKQRPPLNFKRPLEHVFIVQSHCHSEISLEQIEDIKRIACLRAQKRLEKLVFIDWMNKNHIKEIPSSKCMAERVFPFWRESDELCLNVRNKIGDMSYFFSDKHSDLISAGILNIENKLADTLRGAMKS